jgi:hypothetical protein
MKIDLNEFDDAKVICFNEAKAKWESKSCRHRRIIVDEELAEVVCETCGAKLNPVAMLARFSKEETRWVRERNSLIELRKQLEEKQRCKCQHCGKFTRIRP